MFILCWLVICGWYGYDYYDDVDWRQSSRRMWAECVDKDTTIEIDQSGVTQRVPGRGTMTRGLLDLLVQKCGMRIRVDARRARCRWRCCLDDLNEHCQSTLLIGVDPIYPCDTTRLLVFLSALTPECVLRSVMSGVFWRFFATNKHQGEHRKCYWPRLFVCSGLIRLNNGRFVYKDHDFLYYTWLVTYYPHSLTVLMSQHADNL